MFHCCLLPLPFSLVRFFFLLFLDVKMEVCLFNPKSEPLLVVFCLTYTIQRSKETDEYFAIKSVLYDYFDSVDATSRYTNVVLKILLVCTAQKLTYRFTFNIQRYFREAAKLMHYCRQIVLVFFLVTLFGLCRSELHGDNVCTGEQL